MQKKLKGPSKFSMKWYSLQNKKVERMGSHLLATDKRKKGETAKDHLYRMNIIYLRQKKMLLS